MAEEASLNGVPGADAAAKDADTIRGPDEIMDNIAASKDVSNGENNADGPEMADTDSGANDVTADEEASKDVEINDGASASHGADDPNHETAKKVASKDSKVVNDRTLAIRSLRKRMRALEKQLRDSGIDISPEPAEDLAKQSIDGKGDSSDITEDETDDETKSDEIQYPGKSIQRLQDRIDYIEDRLEDQGILGNKDSKSDPERLPAIPKLHYVDWNDFKNKFAEAKQMYAIEVLVGEAKYFHQELEESKRGKKRLEDSREDEIGDAGMANESVFSSPNVVKELPERIRINSRPILENLAEIDPAMAISGNSLVMLRPFKVLIYHAASIRQRYETLNDKWGALEASTGSEPIDVAAINNGVAEDVNPSLLKGSIPGEGQAKSKNPLEDAPTAALPTHEPETTNDSSVEPSAESNKMDEASDSNKTKNSAGSETGKSDQSAGLPISKPVPETNSIDEVAGSEERKAPTKLLAEAKETSATQGDQKKARRKKKLEPADVADSVEALKDFRCLIDFINKELKPVVDALELNTQTKIAFSNLWFIFRPGELAIAPLGSKSAGEIGVEMGGTTYPRRPTDRFQEAWRVFSTANGRPNLVPKGAITPDFTSSEDLVNTFDVATYHVDFIGSRFVTRTFRFSLRPFKGTKLITSLDVYPVRFAPEAERKTSSWASRGKSFLQYVTFQQRYFKGRSLTCHPSGLHRDKDEFPKHAENIDSQVVVDFNEALDANPGWTPLANLPDIPEMAPREFLEEYSIRYWKDREQRDRLKSAEETIHHDRYIDVKMLDDYRLIDEMIKDFPDANLAEEGKFEDKHLVLLPNRVFAFVLRNRKFALLPVDGLRPIKRYLEGFNDLQLPSDHKQTVKSLVYNHFANKNADTHDLDASHDADLVRGKGNGLIVLLHGAPGVGKTSTAECVAEAFGRLLFPITCGDLGLVAEDVESELSEKFHLAELWDCVLLLDEADVFLARRTNTDVKRNSLVSVFLRMLEYFTGILFLTTNRVGAFDEAFKSRIHISLYYPPLDWQQTDKIWKMNLRRLKEKKKRRRETLHVDEEDILHYAYDHFQYTLKKNMNWNGRQIKNAVQTATALAEYDAQQKTDKALVEYKSQLKEAGGDKSDLGSSPMVTDPVLRVSHFKKVAGASFEFDRYISATKGFTDAEFAYQNMERADHLRSDGAPAQQREQQQASMYMPPEPTNPTGTGYYARAPRQPVRQPTQPPAPENPQFYNHNPSFFPNEPSHDLQRITSDHTGMSARQPPQQMQQYPPPQALSSIRTQQRPGLQTDPRASIGNMQSYYESTQMHPSEITHRQAEQSEYAMRFQDAPPSMPPPSKIVGGGWEAERSNASASETFERRRSPQRQDQVQQRQLSPQRQDPFQRTFSPQIQQQSQQAQFRGGVGDDGGSIFG